MDIDDPTTLTILSEPTRVVNVPIGTDREYINAVICAAMMEGRLTIDWASLVQDNED